MELLFDELSVDSTLSLPWNISFFGEEFITKEKIYKPLISLTGIFDGPTE